MRRHPTRRRFLTELTAGTVLIPTATAATGNQLPPTVASLEAYWENIRGQFIFDEQRVPMNAANLCPSPRGVAERVSALTQDIDRDCSSQNRQKFRVLLEQTREKIAKSLGTSANQLALVRNTSEANNIVNSGLPLKAGDEVVLWDQNHPTNNVAWEVRAARFGFSVTRVSTPSRPTGIDELVDTFERALTPNTRVLALTHVSNVTGIRLPISHLCDVAHRLGIHVHVDGAQSWGALAVDLEKLACDSFTASAHKWFLGPKEVGLLYVRPETVDRLWPSVVAPSWGDQVEPRPVGARKFESMGQRDDAALAATGTADDFHSRIGRTQIEDRITTLTTRLKEGLVEAGYQLVTPMDPDLSGGVCVAEVPSNERLELIARLYTEHGIAAAATGGLRLCPHLYNTAEHIDRAVSGAKKLKA